MPRFTPLSSSAQTAYAQLLDASHAAELMRTVADLPGTFARKQVKGRPYWYYQYLDVSGKQRQVYVGPENERVLALIATRAEGGAKPALQALAQSAVALGNAPMLPKHFKVMQRLSDYGFFRAGGVLIGTHAFLAFGNMLGVRWTDGQRTQDVDFAHAGKALAIALPADVEIDVHAALDSLRMGLLPIERSDGGIGGTYLDPKDPEFQIDFLTPLHRDGMKPFRHPQLGITLQPLKFMEYLLQDIQQAVAFAGSGVAVVNVPHPARYALHKLLVAGERPASRIAKSNKDIQQSAALLSLLKEQAEGQVQDAWADIRNRGPGWLSRLQQGYAALARVAPELDVVGWLRF
ncbi:GSU2403 family nucleotidyltransferase fold protein [Arenimonas oryziterrae]|uniref:Nucleotidyltransferase-like domain-containing protein n=1 Tax=Arenimonas oryziterrae DSM 21050 = YC6267 TaxID=1121015 RepID=A0A091AY28_9GAMM|nr:nucleotidyltransferase domain-containing protein [Arenimonas oryziterrae]KFN43539.1 hypothetical protein N789_09700 [Arenimonas oryziterrae DSM 21050 = YC6267]